MMPRIWTSLALRLAVVLAFPQLFSAWQDSSQGANQNTAYKVAGTVINSVTARPIPRVLVTLTGLPERAMLTGAQGDFSFDNLSPGNMEIRVSKPGFFRVGEKPNSNSPIPIRVGPDTGNLTIRLDPEAIITGSVFGKGQEPMEGSFVDVLKWQIIDGRRRLTPFRRTASTDEDGNFRIAGLAPGRYYISVKARRASRNILDTALGSANEAYPAQVYFPAAEDIASAAPVDLAAGQHLDVRFNLKPVASFKVAGVITNGSEWKQLDGPMIVDELGLSLFQVERFDSRTGAFEFRAVPAGSYWLQLGATDQNGRYSGSHQKITVQGNVADLRLVVPHGINVPVVVRTEFTRPESVRRGDCTHFSPSGEMQKLDCADFPAVHVQLIAVDFGNMTFFSDTGPLKAGLFVHGVGPGRYTVQISPAFSGYVQSARCADVDLLREPLPVPESGSVPPIEVVLRDDSATLNIQVNVEKSTQASLVIAFRDGVIAESQIKAFMAGSGTFSLPPGAYRIFAFDTTEEVDYADPETLSKYSSKAASITVAANEHAIVVVDLIHTGE